MGEKFRLLGLALGAASFVLHLSAFLVYYRKTLKGENRPNAASWSIWAFAATLNCLSYFSIGRDWVKALQPLAGSLACIGVFVLSLVRGKLSRPGPFDWVAMTIGLLSVLTWRLLDSAAYANLVLQWAFLVSFVPTWRDVWKKPGESPTAWMMWAGAYVLLTAVVVLRWQGRPAELVYPLLAMATHGSVGVLAVVLRRAARTAEA